MSTMTAIANANVDESIYEPNMIITHNGESDLVKLDKIICLRNEHLFAQIQKIINQLDQTNAKQEVLDAKIECLKISINQLVENSDSANYQIIQMTKYFKEIAKCAKEQVIGKKSRSIFQRLFK